MISLNFDGLWITDEGFLVIVHGPEAYRINLASGELTSVEITTNGTAVGHGKLTIKRRGDEDSFYYLGKQHRWPPKAIEAYSRFLASKGTGPA